MVSSDIVSPQADVAVRLDVDRNQFRLKAMPNSLLKCATSFSILFPLSFTAFFNTLINCRKTAVSLVAYRENPRLFVSRKGSGNASLNAHVAVRKTCAQYSNGSCNPQILRAIQVTHEAAANLAVSEQSAMNSGRQHSNATSKRYYIRAELMKNAERAQEVCSRLIKEQDDAAASHTQLSHAPVRA